jgi:hypothetical protein
MILKIFGYEESEFMYEEQQMLRELSQKVKLLLKENSRLKR